MASTRRAWCSGLAIGLIAVATVVGCSFSPRSTPIDSSIIPDTIGVDAAELPASCNDLHMKDASWLSGPYPIDPDGSGSDAPFMVTCDMSTAGGGWTIVFMQDGDLDSTSIAYTSSSPRLLTDATMALLAYRDATQTVVSDYATLMTIPDAWRTDTPFDADGSDEPAMASVDGSAARSTQLRYGHDAFVGTNCESDWDPSAPPNGRICMEGLTAPFYVGFASATPDNCGNSIVTDGSAPCSAEIQFSIAVK